MERRFPQEPGGQLAMGLPAAPTGGADETFFRVAEAELRSLMDRAATRLERGSEHGRRLALLRTEIERTWLQARQGVHKAHYSC